MSNSSGGFLEAILAFIKALFGGSASQQPPGSSEPTPVPPSGPEPAVLVSPRVLLIVYDPIVDPATGMKLTQRMGWKRPEDLTSGFISDILETSSGLGRYQIVQRIEVNEFPVKVDGFRYTAQAYLDVMNGKTQPHNPDMVNYQDFLNRFNILQRVAANEIDEVWAFAFPYAGFYESTMGGYGAFFCNSGPLMGTSKCPRRFVVMGFSYERGVGEMLEAFNHRVESTLEKVYSSSRGGANLWKKFAQFDKSLPGQAEVGTVHYAPNGERDYDWGNTRYVPSRCDDWYNFPNFQGVSKQVNCAEWGGGDIRAYHKWWLKHLPKVSGRTNGIANNWWQYILDLNRVLV